MREVEARIEEDMDPVRRRAAAWTPTRSWSSASCAHWLAALVEMGYQSVGYRRVKNPRIWSLHDLGRDRAGACADAADGRRFAPTLTLTARPTDDGKVVLYAPSPGLWRGAPPKGALVTAGAMLGELEVLG